MSLLQHTLTHADWKEEGILEVHHIMIRVANQQSSCVRKCNLNYKRDCTLDSVSELYSRDMPVDSGRARPGRSIRLSVCRNVDRDRVSVHSSIVHQVVPTANYASCRLNPDP